MGLALGGLAAHAVPVSSAVTAAQAVPVSCPLFPPFDSSLPTAAPVAPVPLGAPVLTSAPSVAAAPSRVPLYAPVSLPPQHGTFGVTPVELPEDAPDELPEDDAPDVIHRDPDPSLSAGVADSFLSEFRRLLSFTVDLFPQAAGSPSVSPPPHVLFEDFFASSAVPLQPIFLNWCERIPVWLHPSLLVARISPSFLRVLPPVRFMGILRWVEQFLLTLRCCRFSNTL